MANDPDLAPACDLSPDEARRRSAILEAIGDWDPVQALAEEHQASECCTPAWMTSSGAHTTSLSAPVYSRVGQILWPPIGPHADPSRRAWLRCPHCGRGTGCRDCEGGPNCGIHGQNLLANQGPVVFLQCPGCTHLWKLDTGWRAAKRPLNSHDDG
jgi:hypothetical protein